MSYTIYSLIVRLFNVYEVLIVVWCLMSWIPRGIGKGGVDTFREALGMIVCPYLNLFRRFIPPFSGIDFSPILAIFALQIIERLVLYIIF